MSRSADVVEVRRELSEEEFHAFASMLHRFAVKHDMMPEGAISIGIDQGWGGDYPALVFDVPSRLVPKTEGGDA
tara:strand:+ start:470 stop:691 length:222 start_codon:yes stop_codon:yes gene_type:complete